MSSRSAWIILLCEDKQHEVFLRRFLKRSNIRNHDFYISTSPPGEGDAKQWIRDNLPRQLAAFKNYNAKNRSAKRILCVMADADNKTVEQRIADITSSCKPTPHENVCFIIPRWAVETWLKYLRGESIDESVKIQPQDKCRRERECWSQVDKLKDMCDSGSLNEPAPDSLNKACVQFQQVRDVLQR